MAFAITEPDAGSNSHRITTTARRDGSDWILSGQKVWISGLDQAQYVLVVGRTEEQKTGNLRPALFVVPTDAPGSPSPRSPWKSSVRRTSSRSSSTKSGYRPTLWWAPRMPPSPNCSPG